MSADYWQRQERVKSGLNAFLVEEGVLAVLGTDGRGDGGIVFVENGGSWDPGAPVPPPIIALAPEPYDRMVRLVEKNVKVAVEVELAARFHDDAPDGVNVVAEIPGGKKKDEVVMLGAHLDSWHAGTGATDNAAGCAVVLEAFRILDVYDHVQSGDLMQASAVLASFVYGAAVRPDKLPRKPLPRPLPARKADRAASAGG
jgi:carboxypeptidase Q